MLKEYTRYMIVGFATITAFCIFFYIAPIMILFGLLAMLLLIMSLVVGYIIVDIYDDWRKDNEQNKSRKKAPSSKDAKSNTPL